jgi:hypothetical protein
MITVAHVVQAAIDSGLAYAADRRYVVLTSSTGQYVVDTKYTDAAALTAIVAKLA